MKLSYLKTRKILILLAIEANITAPFFVMKAGPAVSPVPTVSPQPYRD